MEIPHTNTPESTSTTRIFKHLNQQDNYSLWMLILLCSLETLITVSLYWFHSVNELLGSLIFILLFTIFSGGIIGLFIDAKRHHHPSGFSPVILTKLLGNAIAPRKLGIIYLFVFVIHLGWITNSSFDLISTDGSEFNVRILIPLFTAIAGIFCLVSFFPDPNTKKNDNAVKVFVSGISSLDFTRLKQIMGLKEVWENNPTIKAIEEGVNLIPLVRMLTLLKPSDPCKLVILKSSDGIKNALPPSSKKESASKAASHSTAPNTVEKPPMDIFPCPVQANSDKTYTPESLKNDFITAITFWNPTESNEEKQKRNQLYKEYQINTDTFHASHSNEEVDKFLSLLIKLFARFELPGHAEAIKKMDITFTEPCDYNNYSECFEKVNAITNSLDNEEHEVIFNLTPGTVVVSSVMTLLAIDGDRKLYYHEQGSKETDIAKRIKEVDKSKLPIQNLLSQALEKLSGGYGESEK